MAQRKIIKNRLVSEEEIINNNFYFSVMMKQMRCASMFKRLSTDSGFVDFRDYFGRFLIRIRGVIYEGLILPPEFGSKIGQNNPENRRNLNP
jgi:hypothetical protein